MSEPGGGNAVGPLRHTFERRGAIQPHRQIRYVETQRICCGDVVSQHNGVPSVNPLQFLDGHHPKTLLEFGGTTLDMGDKEGIVILCLGGKVLLKVELEGLWIFCDALLNAEAWSACTTRSVSTMEV